MTNRKLPSLVLCAVVVLQGAMGALAVPRQAFADATCSTWETNYYGKAFDAARPICFVFNAFNLGAPLIVIQLAVAFGAFEVYVAPGRATQLSDKLSDPLPITPQDTEPLRYGLYYQPLTGEYTIAVVPVTAGRFTLDMRLSFNDLPSDPASSDGPLTELPSGGGHEVGISLGPGKRTSLSFLVPCPGSIRATVSAKENVASVTLALYSPGRVQPKRSVSGRPPRTLTYSATAADFGTSKRWRLTVTNTSNRSNTFKVDVRVPNVQSCPQPQPQPTTPQTFVFQEGRGPIAGYAGADDATIKQAKPFEVDGFNPVCLVDGNGHEGTGQDYATLLRWQLNRIPTNARVTAAAIRLTVFDASANTYPIYPLLKPWVESQVTWNQYQPGIGWGAQGASSPADRSNFSIGNLQASNTGIVVIPLNSQGIAIVQSWVSQPQTNHGVIIANPQAEDGIDFHCSEYADPTLRPALAVSFVSR